MKKKFYVIFSICLMLVICLSFSIHSKTSYVMATNIDYDVKSYCLMDANTGKILEEKNCNERYEVASMVKLMTSLLTMEKIESGEWSLDTTLTVSEYAASMEGSQAFLDAGKDYKLEDLLKSVIVASANDSSVVLAEGYAGTENAFVEIMNKKAKELGMENTLYGNSTGLPALNQYSTASDIAKLLNIVASHDLYQKYSTIWMDNLVHESGRVTELVNTNRLIKYYPGCECGKTGFTDEAGYCLSVSAKRNNMRLISVIMGARSSSDRFSISSNLLNYGFSNYKSVQLVDSSTVMQTTNKIKGLSEFVECKAEKDLYITQRCGENTSEYTTKTEFKKLNTPIKQGDVIGTIYVVTSNNEIIAQTNLVATNDYKSPNFTDIMHNIFNQWSI